MGKPVKLRGRNPRTMNHIIPAEVNEQIEEIYKEYKIPLATMVVLGLKLFIEDWNRERSTIRESPPEHDADGLPIS